ncbi:heavy metal-binding domain-containing protein [Pontibacter rugosus]
MRKKLRNSMLYLLAFLVVVTLGACSHEETEHAEGGTEYTCPMHPQIVQNEPGTCPICGMDLVPKSGHGTAVEITEDLAFLLRPTNTTVVSSVATTKPQEKQYRLPWKWKASSPMTPGGYIPCLPVWAAVSKRSLSSTTFSPSVKGRS